MAARILRGVIALFCIVLIMPVALVHAVEYGGLGGVPANPDPNNPRTKSIFVYTISPGGSKQDGVNVVNNTDETKAIEVYATDSEIASGGSFACRQKVDPKNLVGGWIKLSQTEVSLAPGKSQVLPFNVDVPKGADVGEHNGCIVIQEKQGEQQQAENGVALSFRSALRVAITVPGDIIKNVEFTDLRIKSESKKHTITASLVNEGNVSLDTDVKVSVKNWLNKTVYENGGIYPLLAQKNPVELNFEFPRPFWGGFYKVAGQAEYNGDPKVALGQAAPKDVLKHAPNRTLIVPPQPLALALELFVLLLLIVLAWIVARRLIRRKKAARSISWRSYAVRDGDTLPRLARRLGADWKNIAKVNKLKPPYELKKGMVIRLPIKRKID